MANLTGPWVAPIDDEDRKLQPPDGKGRALALSGGGLRATLFHLGVVERLYQLGALPKLSYLTSVSGGSILAGLLALTWRELTTAPIDPARFDALIVQPIRKLSQLDLRDRALRRALLSQRAPVVCLAELLHEFYEGKTLGDLPPRKELCVSFNSCNLTSGKLFHFTQGYVGARDGYSLSGWQDVPVATAVAASAAFPVFFAPLRVTLAGPICTWDSHGFTPRPTDADAQREVLLADGGIFENMGLQAAQHNADEIFVSNAGAVIENDASNGGSMIDSLVRAVTVIMSRNSHNLTDPLPKKDAKIVFVESWASVDGGYSPAQAMALAALRTDLDVFSDEECAALRFHGASLVGAALQRQATAIRWAPPPASVGDPPAVDLARLESGRRNRVSELFLRFWQH